MADDTINFGTERNRKRYEALSPEGKAALARVRAENRTPEKRAELARVRELVEQEFPPLRPPAEVAATADEPDEALSGLLATLKMERERQGLSLNDVCKRTGYSLSTVSRLELGKVPNPTYGTLRTIARALGLELEWSTHPLEAKS